MFVDLDWPLNASSLLSASAELLVDTVMRLAFAIAIFYCIVFIADIASVLNLGGVYNNDSTSIRPRDRDDHWTTYICAADHTDISEMVDNTDYKLFYKILNNAS